MLQARCLGQCMQGASGAWRCPWLRVLARDVHPHRGCPARRSLYGMLLAEEAATSSRAALMLSLVHKAMGADLRAARVAAFAKRMLQLALAHAAPFACGCLIVVSSVLQVRRACLRTSGFRARLWAAAESPPGALRVCRNRIARLLCREVCPAAAVILLDSPGSLRAAGPALLVLQTQQQGAAGSPAAGASAGLQLTAG